MSATTNGESRRLRVSLFADAYDEVPKPWEGSWDDFCAQLGPHKYDHGLTDKRGCGAFSPAEFQPGAQNKADESAVAVDLFVLDIDHSTEQAVTALTTAIGEAGLAHLIYTTWRHAEDPWRVRIVLPLSRPVLAAEWPDFWARANQALGGACDPKCRNVGHIYFGPYAPPGTEDKNFYRAVPGVPLDIDKVSRLALTTPVQLSAEVRATLHVPPDRFEKFANQLAGNKKNGHEADLGDALQKVCKGEKFAEPGERDNVIFKLTDRIARRWPDCDPGQVAGHFATSLQAMAMVAPDCPSVDDVAYKLRRALDAVKAEEQVKVDAGRARISEAFGNGRDYPYTPDELRRIPQRRWIIQQDRSLYFRLLDDYVGPLTEKAALADAVIDLSPACSAGVELFKLDSKGGIAQKTILELVRDYGTVALRTEIHFMAQRTHYDDATRTIIEAPCPLRKIAPTYHPEIARWLELFAGEKLELLKCWLAAVTWLDNPTPALLVTGPKDVGKSLLANGTARLWTEGQPTPLEEAFANFNDALLHCPLCFADEQMPKDFRGYAKTAELRLHTQARSRSLKRKFLPTAELKGATRTIIAANNEGILATNENLTSDDIDAIAARYLNISVPPAAAEYLRSVDHADWVGGDKIAAHVLWLRDNHLWISKGRFLIDVDDPRLVHSLTTRSGNRAAVCQWLVGYLRDPGKFLCDARGQKLVRIKDGQLLVNVKGIVSCWDHYVSNEPCPKTGNLQQALRALYEPVEHDKRPRLEWSVGNKERVYYQKINVEQVIQWAEDTGFADREEIEEALGTDTEKRDFKIPSPSATLAESLAEGQRRTRSN